MPSKICSSTRSPESASPKPSVRLPLCHSRPTSLIRFANSEAPPEAAREGCQEGREGRRRSSQAQEGEAGERGGLDAEPVLRDPQPRRQQAPPDPRPQPVPAQVQRHHRSARVPEEVRVG
ncbi:hypothetical protein MPH_10035 [Macrophomina phaseolina MS6]|uniref:Uncharacterized protein n=1 Tax=Macrophomina phaseolina (strain MS6) TaxID=1126212 RepID=K2RIS3_MACPH|nr:hypothetical protein MPH_10035 [Macrophomina phaseolina MS6]